MKRTPLKRKSWPKLKRTRIKPISKKRIAENLIRGEVIADVVARDGYRCFAKDLWPEVTCWSRLHPHELLSRARGGSITDKSNIRLVCESHHSAIHDNPEEAHRRGLLRHAWDEKLDLKP